MKGTIDYLTEVKKICTENNGSCKNCILGNQKNIIDTICPRLTEPRSWSKEKIIKMTKSC